MVEVAKVKKGSSRKDRKVSTTWEDAKNALLKTILRVEAVDAHEHSNMAKA